MPRQNIFLTTDCVIFSFGQKETKVLLIKRKSNPYQGEWALPGGFLENPEDLETGAKRELAEETGLVVENLHQIGAFGAPERDPRGRTVSIAYWGEVNSTPTVKASDDAVDAQWFSIDRLPGLAFDHRIIIKDALKKVLHYKAL